MARTFGSGNVKLIYKHRSSAIRAIKNLGLKEGDFDFYADGSGKIWIVRILTAALNRLNLAEKGYLVK